MFKVITIVVEHSRQLRNREGPIRKFIKVIPKKLLHCKRQFDHFGPRVNIKSLLKTQLSDCQFASVLNTSASCQKHLARLRK